MNQAIPGKISGAVITREWEGEVEKEKREEEGSNNHNQLPTESASPCRATFTEILKERHRTVLCIAVKEIIVISVCFLSFPCFL